MRAGSATPGRVGIGLRGPHFAAFCASTAAVDFVEVHTENFLAPGGAALASLERVRGRQALSLHGVGLSLGSADPLDERHMARIDALVRRVEPCLVSEHLAWSSVGGRHAHELLPLPRSRACADHLVARIGQVQDRLRRRILVENVTAYVQVPGADMPEWEFAAQVARRSGCGLLLDVNNVWVSASHQGFDPRRYIEALPTNCVDEIHLAGFEATEEGLVDSHGADVAAPVWALYAAAVARFGPRPTVVERDANLPPLESLLAEAARARDVMQAVETA